ncbi:hypothetical protein GLAREA_03874 [Glarea lozoyensis ATCC 20868]|uniref:Uncharacterized protein n=1 Tax=Glarea lozoyensis (strain ATCC 20868 / MF5171) TaxID=1116229 RepID=S3CX33_GLAL2|nr:uncharacterized protein GLAREA_03874 [Glarea lozoyensis ATCC 20868]EPE30907.1 hypothetical protein GLAREA_03874 [Glarea lozoyensis ATCC 20868]
MSSPSNFKSGREAFRHWQRNALDKPNSPVRSDDVNTTSNIQNSAGTKQLPGFSEVMEQLTASQVQDQRNRHDANCQSSRVPKRLRDVSDFDLPQLHITKKKHTMEANFGDGATSSAQPDSQATEATSPYDRGSSPLSDSELIRISEEMEVEKEIAQADKEKLEVMTRAEIHTPTENDKVVTPSFRACEPEHQPPVNTPTQPAVITGHLGNEPFPDFDESMENNLRNKALSGTPQPGVNHFMNVPDYKSTRVSVTRPEVQWILSKSKAEFESSGSPVAAALNSKILAAVKNTATSHKPIPFVPGISMVDRQGMQPRVYEASGPDSSYEEEIWGDSTSALDGPTMHESRNLNRIMLQLNAPAAPSTGLFDFFNFAPPSFVQMHQRQLSYQPNMVNYSAAPHYPDSSCFFQASMPISESAERYTLQNREFGVAHNPFHPPQVHGSEHWVSPEYRQELEVRPPAPRDFQFLSQSQRTETSSGWHGPRFLTDDHHNHFPEHYFGGHQMLPNSLMTESAPPQNSRERPCSPEYSPKSPAFSPRVDDRATPHEGEASGNTNPSWYGDNSQAQEEQPYSPSSPSLSSRVNDRDTSYEGEALRTTDPSWVAENSHARQGQPHFPVYPPRFLLYSSSDCYHLGTPYEGEASRNSGSLWPGDNSHARQEQIAEPVFPSHDIDIQAGSREDRFKVGAFNHRFREELLPEQEQNRRSTGNAIPVRWATDEEIRWGKKGVTQENISRNEMAREEIAQDEVLKEKTLRDDIQQAETLREKTTHPEARKMNPSLMNMFFSTHSPQIPSTNDPGREDKSTDGESTGSESGSESDSNSDNNSSDDNNDTADNYGDDEAGESDTQEETDREDMEEREDSVSEVSSCTLDHEEGPETEVEDDSMEVDVLGSEDEYDMDIYDLDPVDEEY